MRIYLERKDDVPAWRYETENELDEILLTSLHLISLHQPLEEPAHTRMSHLRDGEEVDWASYHEMTHGTIGSLPKEIPEQGLYDIEDSFLKMIEIDFNRGYSSRTSRPATNTEIYLWYLMCYIPMRPEDSSVAHLAAWMQSVLTTSILRKEKLDNLGF